MRTIVAVFSAIALVALPFGKAAAQAPPVDGSWDISWDMPQGQSRTITVEIHRNGNVLSGTAQIPGMQTTGDDSVWETAITDGRIDGDHVIFSIPLGNGMQGHMQGSTGQGNDRVLQFTGVVGSRGVMGGFLTGASVMQGVMTGSKGDPALEIPFRGFRQ